MAKISANYEVVYILDPAQGERLLPPSGKVPGSG